MKETQIFEAWADYVINERNSIKIHSPRGTDGTREISKDIKVLSQRAYPNLSPEQALLYYIGDRILATDKQYSSLSKENQTLKQEIQDIKQNVQKVNANKKPSNNTPKISKITMADVNRMIDKVSSDMDSATGKKITDLISTLQNKYATATEVKRIEQAINSNKIKKIQSEIESIHHNNDQTKRDQQEMSDKISSVTDDIMMANSEIEDIKQSKDDNQTIQQNIQNLQSRIERIVNNVDAMTKNQNDSVSQNQIEPIKSEIDSLQQKMNELSKNDRLAQYNNKFKKIQSNIDSMQGEFSNIRGDIFKAALDTLPTSVENLKTELKNISSRVRDIETGLENIPDRVKNLETGLKNIPNDLNSQLRGLRSDNERTRYLVSRIERRITDDPPPSVAESKIHLREGGNVFKHPEYTKDNRRMLTRRINKSEVPQVVEHLTDLVGFDVSEQLLGSTGVAETSGDIDVAVDANKFSKDSIIAKLLSHDVPPESISKTGSSVHYKAPIGDTGDFVQVDFMLVPDVEFALWSMHAQPRNSRYRGADWQRVMNDVVRGTNSNWKWSTFEGVLTRDTNENVFGRNPDKIVAGLFGDGTVPEDIHSVEQILELIPLNDNYKTIQSLIAKTLSGDLRVPQIKESVTDKYINNLSKWINEISTSKRT
jgi:predicted  nucleic acid-binding Zn-ribbon protein